MKRNYNVSTPPAAADTASGDARSQRADLVSSTNGMIDHYSPVTINSGDQLAGLAQADAKPGAFKIVATHFGPQHTVERSVCNTQNSTMSS